MSIAKRMYESGFPRTDDAGTPTLVTMTSADPETMRHRQRDVPSIRAGASDVESVARSLRTTSVKPKPKSHGPSLF